MDANTVEERKQVWKESFYALEAILIPTLSVVILVVVGNALYDHLDCGARSHEAKIDLYWWSMELGEANGAAVNASLDDLPEAIEHLEYERDGLAYYPFPHCAKNAQGALLDATDASLRVQHLRLEGASSEEIEQAQAEAAAHSKVFHTLMEEWILEPPSY